MILSTCNRVEIYAFGTDPLSAASIVGFFGEFHGKEPAEFESYLYLVEGEEAVRHAFRVAASLDSMVLGEPQILGQGKDADEEAGEAGGRRARALTHRPTPQ